MIPKPSAKQPMDTEHEEGRIYEEEPDQNTVNKVKSAEAAAAIISGVECYANRRQRVSEMPATTLDAWRTVLLRTLDLSEDEVTEHWTKMQSINCSPYRNFREAAHGAIEGAATPIEHIALRSLRAAKILDATTDHFDWRVEEAVGLLMV